MEELQRKPVYLEMDPSNGYQPYVASQHVLNTLSGYTLVGIMSEMTRREGKESAWRTTVTTVQELQQQLAAKQDIPH